MFMAILKKELLQFMRSKSSMMMMFLFPIVLITVIGAGMENFMSGNINMFGKDSGKHIVYYSVKDSLELEDAMNIFIDEVTKDAEIEFKEIDNLENVRKEIDNYTAIAFIEIKEEKFTYYTSSKGESTRSKVLRSIFEQFIEQYKLIGVAAKISPDKINEIINKERVEYVQEEGLNGVKDINSYEYFTFAELALSIFYIASTVGYSVYKENESGTINRIRLSKAKELTNISAKMTFGVIVGICQILVIYLHSTYLLDVDWGSNTLYMMGIFLSFAIFASTLGIIVGLLSKLPTSVDGTIGFIAVIINALGGSYCPIFMLTALPIVSELIKISPIYWINIGVSSLNCGLKNSAPIIAVSTLIILTIICVVAYFVIKKKRSAFGDV